MNSRKKEQKKNARERRNKYCKRGKSANRNYSRDGQNKMREITAF